MPQLESYKVSNNSLIDEKSELSKTMKEESIKDKSKDRDDRQLAEVVMLKKHQKGRVKIDTGSMLKNIKPVF
jgi:hypothetical protein